MLCDKSQFPCFLCQHEALLLRAVRCSRGSGNRITFLTLDLLRLPACERTTHITKWNRSRLLGYDGWLCLNAKLNQSGVLCSNRVHLSGFICLPLFYLALLGCLQRLGPLSSTVLSRFSSYCLILKVPYQVDTADLSFLCLHSRSKWLLVLYISGSSSLFQTL